jgi:hypothetical protein
MLIPIIPILIFLTVLLVFAWWMDKPGDVRLGHSAVTSMRGAASLLVGSLAIAAVFRAIFPLSGISGGGPLVVAAIAYAAGLLVACLVRPAAKDDLLLWLLLLAVTVVATYAAVT